MISSITFGTHHNIHENLDVHGQTLDAAPITDILPCQEDPTTNPWRTSEEIGNPPPNWKPHKCLLPLLPTSKIMVFDTETNGLPSKTFKPYILQLSFLIYNVMERKIERTYNTYIRVPDTVYISAKITELTGITKCHCASGIPMKEALREFYREYQKCDIIVAHNIKFDKERIRDEIDRYGDQLRIDGCQDIDQVFSYSETKKLFYCTMLHGIHICNLTYNISKTIPNIPKIPEIQGIMITRGQKRKILEKHSSEIHTNIVLDPELRSSSKHWHASGIHPSTTLLTYQIQHPRSNMDYKKKPKLVELYQHLYGHIPSGLHDALVDTKICFQCFLRMNHMEEPYFLQDGFV
jgi:Exonuclease